MKTADDEFIIKTSARFRIHLVSNTGNTLCLGNSIVF